MANRGPLRCTSIDTRLQFANLPPQMRRPRLGAGEMTPDVSNRCPHLPGRDITTELKDTFVVTLIVVVATAGCGRQSHGGPARGFVTDDG